MYLIMSLKSSIEALDKERGQAEDSSSSRTLDWPSRRCDQHDASNTLLTLHSSQSAPILFRRSLSFDSLKMLSRGTTLTGPLISETATALTSDLKQQQRHCDDDLPSQGHFGQRYSHEELYDDSDDDDDTFLNECDIEDQATIQSQSTINSAVFSSLSSKLNPSIHTLATEEVTMSSDSEDVDVYGTMRLASIPSYPPSFTVSTSEASLRRWERKRSKLRRNDVSSCTISSIGTLSKTRRHRDGILPMCRLSTRMTDDVMCYSSDAKLTVPKVSSAQRQYWPRPRLKLSCIVVFFKMLMTVWVLSMGSFIFYHFYLYPSSPTIFPIASPLKFKPGNGYGWYHIPIPPPDHKVSVILMNHSRPRMIKESALVPTLLGHPSVEEVVILHSNPKTQFNFVHPKVINIDATKENDQMGLSIRFYFCQMAKSDWVLHVDDDMEFTAKTLNEMLYEFSKNTKRIVGRFGRDRNENNYFNGYSSKDTSRETEVILTKFMVMEREICSAFFEYSHLIWEDVVLNNGEGPLWNGEDIFMSLVSNHVYGRYGEKVNYAMDWLDVWSAPEDLKDYSDGKLDISGGFNGYRFWNFSWWRSLLNRNRHYSYRGKLWKEAKDRLESFRLSEPSREQY